MMDVKKGLSVSELRAIIFEKLPNGSIEPRHTDRAHFYHVNSLGKTFASVTGKLQVLKDEGLINYKMNRVIEYIQQHFADITIDNLDTHLEEAKKVPGDILRDAGDIGRLIHDCREAYFKHWIEIGHRPGDATIFVPKDERDIRAVSAMRGLEKFVLENDYVPVVTELLVYDEKSQTAGTLDDIGLIRKYKRKPKIECKHLQVFSEHSEKCLGGVYRCMDCDAKWTYELCLLDLKSSNQFKDHYFFQVSMYYMMFVKLIGLKLTRNFILKLSKEDGSYKIEDLFFIKKLATYAKNMLKVSEGIDFIKSIRKDNQKVVISL